MLIYQIRKLLFVKSNGQFRETHKTRLIDQVANIKTEAQKLIEETTNEKLAIKINLNVKIVKDKEQAKTTFRIVKEGEETVRIIKKLKDTNLTHCYNQKKLEKLLWII